MKDDIEKVFVPVLLGDDGDWDDEQSGGVPVSTKGSDNEGGGPRPAGS